MPAPKGNKFGYNGGRPNAFTSPKDLTKEIEEYFNWCDTNPLQIWHTQLDKSSGQPVQITQQRPYTIEGLSLWLNVDSRTLLNYQRAEGYEDFFPIIIHAKQRIANQRIELATAGVFKEGFTKFLLINNSALDYQDKIVQQTTIDINSTPDWLTKPIEDTE